jgi:poly(A) polymerase
MKLEYEENGLELAHPFVKGFDRVNYCRTKDENEKCACGNFPAEVLKRNSIGDLPGAGNGDEESVMWTSTFYIGLKIRRTEAGEF